MKFGATIIEEITKYFTRLKPIHEVQQSITIIRDDQSNASSSSSMEILKYERSPHSQRGHPLKRSLSTSQPLIRQSMPNFHAYEKRV